MGKLGILIAFVALAVLAMMAPSQAPALAANPDTVKMSLSAKPPGNVEVLVKDTFIISVKMDQISMVDRDEDGVGGYTAWQAEVNFPSELKLVGDPDVVWPDSDALTTAFSATATSVSIGSTVGVDGDGNLNQESTHVGNVVDLTFTCNEPGKTHILTLKADAADTFVLGEPNPGPPPEAKTAKVAITTPSVSVDCRAAAMAFDLTDGSHYQDPETGQFHVKVATKFTVDVVLDPVRNLVDADDPTNTGGYQEVHAEVQYDPNRVKIQDSSVTVPNCETSSITDPAADKHLMKCTAFPASQSAESKFTGAVFRITFTCQNPGKFTLELRAPTKLVDEEKNDVNVFKENISVRCVGSAEDKDNDNCTHAQELANGTDVNVYDFWDTNNNQNIDIADVLNYLLKFGQPADAPPPTANKVNDTNDDDTINILDIGAVVSQFGLSCKP